MSTWLAARRTALRSLPNYRATSLTQLPAASRSQLAHFPLGIRTHVVAEHSFGVVVRPHERNTFSTVIESTTQHGRQFGN